LRQVFSLKYGLLRCLRGLEVTASMSPDEAVFRPFIPCVGISSASIAAALVVNGVSTQFVAVLWLVQ